MFCLRFLTFEESYFKQKMNIGPVEDFFINISKI